MGVNTIFCRQDKTIQELCMSICIRSIIFYNFCALRPIYVDSQKWACIIGYITHFMINEKKTLQLIFCKFCCSLCNFPTIQYTKDTYIKILVTCQTFILNWQTNYNIMKDINLSRSKRYISDILTYIFLVFFTV